ncbi:MAG: TOBE domain-containing protein, partial [Pseudomonadota bacterium]
GLKRDGLEKDRLGARVEEMLKLTQLGKLAKRKPHQLSGGQRQRVALARAMAKGPKLLLLDEPLGALDKKLRQETQFELMDIQEKTGTTFVIVTHDQEEAMTVASRVAVMDEGRVMQVATPQRIYEAPNSTYVADFIGDVTLIGGTARARAQAPKVSETATAPSNAVRGPKPNALGIWLHDKVLAPVIGARTDIQRQLPPPDQNDTDLSVVTKDIPEGGIDIVWADGQPALIALDVDAELDGMEVTLALRPEKVAISKNRPEGAVNALKGTVIDIAYLGNLSTYHVELADGVMIKAQTANTRRVARREITWEDEVWVSWSGTAGVVLST